MPLQRIFDRSGFGAFTRSPLGVRNHGILSPASVFDVQYDGSGAVYVAGAANKPSGKYLTKNGALIWAVDGDGGGEFGRVQVVGSERWWRKGNEFWKLDSAGALEGTCSITAPGGHTYLLQDMWPLGGDGVLVAVGRHIHPSTVENSFSVAFDIATFTEIAHADYRGDNDGHGLQMILADTGTHFILMGSSGVSKREVDLVNGVGAEGASGWSWSPGGGSALAIATDADDNVFVGGEKTGAGLWLLDGSDGTELADADVDDLLAGSTSAPVVTFGGGKYYAVLRPAAGTDTIARLTLASGTWTADLLIPTGGTVSSMSVTGDRLLVGLSGGGGVAGNLRRYHAATGALQWGNGAVAIP